MQQTAILYPVLLQVFLTFVVLILMGPARRQSLAARGQRITDADVALGQIEWSEQATKVSNNFKNQFELPVLFYAGAGFALQLHAVDVFTLTLAWIFALSRVVQTYIHIGPNVVMWRGTAYLVGALALLVLWIRIALRVLGGI